MEKPLLYILHTPALDCAREILAREGVPIADSLNEDVTHILLPIPTRELPEGLSPGCTLIGGNLPCPGIDLLADPVYLAQNAVLTDHSAIKIAMNSLKCCLWDCKTLIFGWGRIAQSLCHLLKGLGVDVTVAARKEEARAMAQALGFSAKAMEGLDCRQYDLVFNTVPANLGLEEDGFRPGCVKIDLASQLALPGPDVIWARGLPGKETPESSGRLIAQRVAYYLNKEASPIIPGIATPVCALVRNDPSSEE